EEIAAALEETRATKMRGEVLSFREGFTLIDDSYNSNPQALLGMIRTMFDNHECRRRIVVAGEMLELGAPGSGIHREAGRAMGLVGINKLIAVRGLGRYFVEGARDAGMNDDSAVFLETPEQAAEALIGEARAGDLILVKGSRGVRTEIVVERMKRKF